MDPQWLFLWVLCYVYILKLDYSMLFEIIENFVAIKVVVRGYTFSSFMYATFAVRVFFDKFFLKFVDFCTVINCF